MKILKITGLFVLVAVILGTALFFFLPKEVSMQSCLVTGDVLTNVALAAVPQEDYVKVRINVRSVRAIPLARLVELSEPLSNSFSVLLMGSDGLFARIEGDELEGCYIAQDKGKWNTIAKKHPVNAGIKDLAQIIIADDTGSLDIGVNVISQTENIFHTTPGSMVMQKWTSYSYLDGETKKKDGYGLSLYKQKQVLALDDIVPEEVESVLVMGRQGDTQYLSGPGYLELSGNQIHFLIPEARTTVRDIAGVIINPPAGSIMDTYADSVHFLSKDEKVMLIYLDGLAWHMYEQAIAEGRIPNIAALGTADKVTSVYKSVTNAGFAAMITGQPPAVNGIVDRSKREPLVETIFDWLETQGKSHILIEGNTGILKLSTETVLSSDQDGDGSTDDEVFEHAMTALEGNRDFVLVHFHGIDDAGHDYGDLDNRTMAVLEEVDDYVGVLMALWEGRVIITSDHGMHQAGQEGDHGSFRFEDMFVPYLVK